MSVKRTSLVAASGDDPLSMLGGGLASKPAMPTVSESGASSPAAAIGARPPALASPLAATAAAALAPSVAARPTSSSVGSTPLTTAQKILKHDDGDIVVDSERARNIAQRLERKEHAPLYVGTAAAAPPTLPARPTSLSSPARPVGALLPPSSSSSSSSSSSASSSSSSSSSVGVGGKSSLGFRRTSAISFKASSLPFRSRDWHPSVQLMKECADDWDSHGKLPGEKAVMQIPEVVCYNAQDEITAVQHCLWGTLFMTSYQLFLEPTQRRDRLGAAVLAIPLSTIDRIELEKSRGGSSSNAVGTILGAPHHLLNYLEVYSKDGRTLRFGFMKFDEAKRAYDCLGSYVFPQKDEFLFAFYYKIKTPIPEHLDGWNLYDPIEEFKRQGINTIPLKPPASLQSDELRLSWANEAYTMCQSYPRVLVVPSEKYVSDLDLLLVAHFRSRGRIPVCTWKHPLTRQTIWRSAQPKVGMNNTRCQEDERLLSAITNYAAYGEMFAIFDARPRFNARANILAGKGFENPDLYRNAVKKIHFQDIQNIHVMRDSHAKLVKACQKEVHDFNFPANVTASGWLNHLACCLRAAGEMVKTIDQDKISLLVHCSDGWDRTAQLCLCLDPYYRTTKGFMVLVEKEWITMGHQFARRTGHREKNYSDDQRSCIFLQWCDTVYQLLVQFPRHFEFNSHFLVTLVHHLYSCRFGTFFHNSDMVRRKMKMKEKTVSVWTYFMCSPAAVAGDFTNPLYSPNGDGSVREYADRTASGPGADSANQGPEEEVGKSSVGRGGGDGSRLSIGTVLYPSSSLKKIALWTDYFLRWQNEQLEQVPIGNSAGSVPPGGCATTRMQGAEAVLQKEIRKVQKEKEAMSLAAAQQAARVRDLEHELQQLKSKYGLDYATSASTPAATSASAIVPPAAVATPALVTDVASTPATAGGSSPAGGPTDEVEEAPSADEQAVIEELKKRLAMDVGDVVEQPDDEKPEDASTL